MKKLLSIIAIVILIFGFLPITDANAATKNLKVHFINVGQGDSILVQAPAGKNMLIDGGPKTAGKDVVSFLKSKGVKTLDYVVATHPDADHIGGLIDVLKSFKVKHFIDSGWTHTTDTYYELLTLVDKKKINYIVPTPLKTYQLDPKMKTQVLYSNNKAEDSNNASIVLKLTYNKVSFLLTGDATKEIEVQLASKYKVNATVLKAGHHGSDTSSSPKFISKVKPKVAILSYGKDNMYGHPHASVVKSLKNVGAKIYKTPIHCNITVTTDGKTHKVTNACPKASTSKASTGKTTTNPSTTTKTSQTKFKNCTEMRKIYPYGVKKGHPAYEKKHDRDGDGVACEK